MSGKTYAYEKGSVSIKADMGQRNTSAETRGRDLDGGYHSWSTGAIKSTIDSPVTAHVGQFLKCTDRLPRHCQES